MVSDVTIYYDQLSWGGHLMTSELGEGEALTLLCGYLDELHEHAERGLWAGRLERVVRGVRDGASAVEACARLGLIVTVDEAETRTGVGGGGPWRVPGLSSPDLPIGRGRYTCPRVVCQRRGKRDADGHPPYCDLFEQPMQPQ
jgi:hypothetical protein